LSPLFGTLEGMPRNDSQEDKRPSAWRLFDALTFGAAATIATGLAVYAQVTEADAHQTQGRALMWAVALLFWLVYLLLVRARYKFIQGYDLVLSNGMMVCTNGYKAGRLELEAEIKRVYRLWTIHFPKTEQLLARPTVWVRFEPKKLELTGFVQTTPRTFAGLTSMGGESIQLSYFEDPLLPLEKTAFAHELGHVIMGRGTGKWDNSVHHKYMQDRKLP